MGNKSTTLWASWADYRRDEQQTTALPSGGDLPCALFFPADYAVGMANLGYHYIYRQLRELGVAVERFFASPIPYRSVERDTLFERFPLILGSVSYEADIPAFAGWLAAGGVTALRSERTDGMPLIGVGGAVTYINPLALSGLADFIVLGDGTPVMPSLVETLRKGAPREDTLHELATHPSILIPSLHGTGEHRRTVSRQLDISLDYGHGNWVTPRSAFGDTLLVELQRGCTRACRYCTLPSCFKPFRQREAGLVARDIERISAVCGFGQVGLVTPEASDYGELDAILDAIGRLEKSVSFASLRVDGISRNALRALVASGRHKLTIAPESGDDALRRSCGKTFTNDRIIEVLRLAKEEGVRGVKLYFMIGLPEEEDRHILAIHALCCRIQAEAGLAITLSVSPFVPKPGTYWGNADFAGERDLKRKYALLVKSFRGNRTATLQCMSVKEACIEYAISWASRGASLEIVRDAPRTPYKRWLGNTDRAGTAFELEQLGYPCISTFS